MRQTPLVTPFILLAATVAWAQDAGGRIVVTAQDAPLKTLNGPVGSVRRGSILTVRQVNGEWSWVVASRDKETVKGWIHRRDVVPIEKAIDFFNDAVTRNASAEFYCIRGTIWAERQEYDKAIADFDEALRLDPEYADAISGRDRARRKRSDASAASHTPGKTMRLDPKHAVSYFKRGLARQQKGDYENALRDFDQALRFDPQHAGAYAARGVAWQIKGDLTKAMADYDEALRRDSKLTAALANRGIVWQKLGEYGKASADWKETIRLDPNDVSSHCSLAWLLATCPDARFRNGKRAVELATKACELSDWKYAAGIVALAAAYAESGDFVNAVKWQEEFLRLGSEADQKKWGFLLDLYKAGKPFRGGRQESGFGSHCRVGMASVA